MVGCGGGSTGGGSNGGGGSSPSPTIVTFSFTEGPPTIAAAMIGSGSYALQSLTSGKLSLSIPNGTTTYAVAYLCTGPSFPAYEGVFEASTADGTSFTLPCIVPGPSDQTATLSTNVNATGIPGANRAYVSVSNGTFLESSEVLLDGSYSFQAPAGSDRVVVLAYQNGQTTLLAAKSFTGQTVPGALNGGNQVVFTAADETTSEPITYSNVPSGYNAPATVAELVMSSGGLNAITLSFDAAQYTVLPASALTTGDSYQFEAATNNSTNVGESMTVYKTSTSAGPLSFTLPPPWTYAGPTPAALPTFTFAYTGISGNTGTFDEGAIDWIGSSGYYSGISVSATANYLNGSTTIAFPDLSSLPGFLAPPPSGTQVSWSAAVEQNSAGPVQSLPTNGGTLTSVQNNGTYTEP